MTYLLPSIRLWLITFVVCVIGYAALVLGFAQAVTPYRASGSIITVDGRAVGSELIAQAFASDRYFWPRPSAADYDGMGAMGSNLSPTSTKLAERAAATVSRYGASADRPLPADLVAASGGGLDPHISLAGAFYQIDRVANAREIDAARLRQIVRDAAHSPGGIFAPEPIVNVLQLNLALDRLER